MSIEGPLLDRRAIEDAFQRLRGLFAARNTEPIRSLEDLAADTFESDEELDEFLAFTHAERQRDIA